MKFLCVPCDKPMTLLETKPPDRGSVSLVYSCDGCGYEMAMLTNPHETQLVSSLGVAIGTEAERNAGAEPAGKCPFTGMVQAATESAAEAGMRWTAEASERLATVPEFVRPMAKSGIEKWAEGKGYQEVDGRVLDEAKDFFGM